MEGTPPRVARSVLMDIVLKGPGDGVEGCPPGAGALRYAGGVFSTAHADQATFAGPRSPSLSATFSSRSKSATFSVIEIALYRPVGEAHRGERGGSPQFWRVFSEG